MCSRDRQPFQDIELKWKGNNTVAREDLGSFYLLLVWLLGQEEFEQSSQRERGQGPDRGCGVRRGQLV